MEFYKITQKEEIYMLVEEGQGGGAMLAQEQLGILLDRLSALYQKRENLSLGIRTYVTAYYSNDQTNYISLKASPSKMMGENCLLTQFGAGIILDGFATTFLDGEMENRVWIGQDGAVENRGPSTQAVRELLECLVEALNQGLLSETVVWETIYSEDFMACMKRIIAYFSNEVHFQEELDLNQGEVQWVLFLDEADQWQVADLRMVCLKEHLAKAVRFDLIHRLCSYQLEFDLLSQRIRLVRFLYPWQEEWDDQWIKQQLALLVA